MSFPGRGHADYLQLGDWNAICSMCGKKFKASELVKHWEGQYRCFKCNEPRHPQDFVRAAPNPERVPWVQGPVDIDILFCDFNGSSGMPGYAYPGCAIPGRSQVYE